MDVPSSRRHARRQIIEDAAVHEQYCRVITPEPAINEETEEVTFLLQQCLELRRGPAAAIFCLEARPWPASPCAHAKQASCAAPHLRGGCPTCKSSRARKGARRAQGQVAVPAGGAAVRDAAAAGGGRALGRAAGALRLGARRAQRARV